MSVVATSHPSTVGTRSLGMWCLTTALSSDSVRPEMAEPRPSHLPSSPSALSLKHILSPISENSSPRSHATTLPSIGELDRRLWQSWREGNWAALLSIDRKTPQLPSPVSTRRRYAFPGPWSSAEQKGAPTVYPYSPPMTDRASSPCRSPSRSSSPAQHNRPSPPRRRCLALPGPPIATTSDTKQASSTRPGTSNARLLAREDRHEYDAEEQYAICFLRMQSNSSHSRWKDLVERHWRFLFPPGAPRRASAAAASNGMLAGAQLGCKAIRPTYVERSPGGLQCRYYRLRDQLGVGGVRKSGGSGPGCGGGRRAGVKNEVAALRRLEVELARYWFRTLARDEIACFGLARRWDEDDVAHMARVRAGYRKHSEFWRLLSSIPDVSHYT